MGEEFKNQFPQLAKVYQQQPVIIEQSNNYQYNQTNINDQYLFCQYEDMQSQPSPTFQYFNHQQFNDDAYSQTIARKQAKINQVSGIHQKYLQSENSQNQKISFRSQRKLNKEKLSVNKFKKQSLTIEQKHKTNEFNPICQGLLALQIETPHLQQQINLHSQTQQQKASLFTQLGLKQPKVIGKSKTQRQLQNLIRFLSSGQMPAQYINDFLLSIST